MDRTAKDIGWAVLLILAVITGYGCSRLPLPFGGGLAVFCGASMALAFVYEAIPVEEVEE